MADWPDGWPSGGAADLLFGYSVTSGGGFIGWKTEYDNNVVGSGVVESGRAYMDGRGPNMNRNGALSEIPGWDSTQRPQQIESAAHLVGGGVITDVAVATPGVDTEHAAQDIATALIYDVTEIIVWQVFI